MAETVLAGIFRCLMWTIGRLSQCFECIPFSLKPFGAVFRQTNKFVSYNFQVCCNIDYSRAQIHGGGGVYPRSITSSRFLSNTGPDIQNKLKLSCQTPRL